MHIQSFMKRLHTLRISWSLIPASDKEYTIEAQKSIAARCTVNIDGETDLPIFLCTVIPSVRCL